MPSGMIIPPGDVVALLHVEPALRRRGDLLRFDVQNDGKAIDDLASRPGLQRVDDFKPANLRAVFTGNHSSHSKAMFRAQSSKEEIRAQLIESMSHQVVGRCMENQASVDSDEAHAIEQRLWKIEDMFEAAAVVDDIIGIMEARRNWL